MGIAQLEGDPISYIFSANIHRRTVTAAQRSMIVAKIHPVEQKSKRLSPEVTTCWQTLMKATLVMKILAELVDQVIRGEAAARHSSMGTGLPQ